MPLVDVTPAHGPTELRPGSHVHTRDPTRLAKAAAGLAKNPLAGAKPAVAPCLRAGGALLFDYRTLHRGLANTMAADALDATAESGGGGGGGGRRPVLCFTLAQPGFRDRVNWPARCIADAVVTPRKQRNDESEAAAWSADLSGKWARAALSIY